MKKTRSDYIKMQNAKFVRAARGKLSQAEYGKKIGLSPKTIHRREEGFDQIAVLLDYPVSEESLKEHIDKLIDFFKKK